MITHVLTVYKGYYKLESVEDRNAYISDARNARYFYEKYGFDCVETVLDCIKDVYHINRENIEIKEF